MRKTKSLLLGSLAAAAAIIYGPAMAQQPQKPNIVIIWGDDIGQSNISAYSRGMMGYQTPNIDRVAREGMMFTDYYAEQSCTAGRASFITGQTLAVILDSAGQAVGLLTLDQVVDAIVRLLERVLLAWRPTFTGT